MIFRLVFSTFLLVSMAAAQKLMPGILASTSIPAPSVNTGAFSSSDARRPITGKERIRWVTESTLGWESLAAGVFSSAWGTGFNMPNEYGPGWEGFGKRYGMRFTGIAVSNSMEAGLGAIWGEDPRYIRDEGAPFGHRLGHAVKMTFMAQNRDGRLMPAYGRWMAITGSNFLSNTWRPDSDATLDRAGIRTGLGFLGRFGSNTFNEFWPDVSQRIFHHKP